MASFQSSFNSEGASINRPPMFNGDGYSYWKVRMKIFIEAIDLDIWNAIENGPFIPMHTSEGKIIEKPRSIWSDDDKKKVQYDLKAKNIITSALGIDEFFRISNCKSAQEMWETLEVTHEGTNEVKRARINSLTREYELFSMNQGESIQDMQKRFTHIVNHLITLGKSFQNEDLINKVLRCLNRNWQPKVTAIAESRDLATMSLATLFGKLQEHELELSRLQQHEENDKKKKSIALKATSTPIQDEDDDNFDSIELNEENLTLLVKKFGKFLKKKGSQRRPSFNSKKNFNKGETTNTTPICYECGKSGHIKMDCLIYQKKMEKHEKKPYKEKKGRRAYIAWEDNDMDSSDESEHEEANLCLMADVDENEVNDLDPLNPNYDELQEAFEELHIESIKLAKKLVKSQKIISLLEENISNLNGELNKLSIEKEALESRDHTCTSCNFQKPSPCTSCNTLQQEIEDLKNALARFTMGRDNLNILLGKQGCHFNKVGLGYDPSKQQKLYKNFFVAYNMSTSPFIKCYYCGRNGHSASTCNIRKNCVLNGRKIWVPKGTLHKTNIQGPKKIWVPKVKT